MDIPAPAVRALLRMAAPIQSGLRIACLLALLWHGFGVSAGVSIGQAQQASARPLGPILARATMPFGFTSVRSLSGGRSLVNDMTAHRLLLVDSTFVAIRVVADTGGVAARRYGDRPGAIIRYLGDSTLFVDGTALALLVIDPSGAIARVVSIPRPQDLYNLITPSAWGNPGIDARGRLIYQVFPGHPLTKGPTGQDTGNLMAEPDSAPLLRVDLATHEIDTLVSLQMRKDDPIARVIAPDGSYTLTTTVNPIKLADDWAVTTDGSVAIVRAHDFHVDWINTDGSMTASPRLPFEWQRLSDSAKASIADSVRKRAEGARRTASPTIHFAFVSPDLDHIPDYASPFVARGTLADADNNIWIQLAPRGPGGPIYDVVDRKGKLIDQVQIPGGTMIVGFGRNAVFLQSRDGTSYSLVRARAR